MIDLSIIIVSYNTKQLLVDCIKSIIDSAPKVSYEIIVIDNNSMDGSAQAIQSVSKGMLKSIRQAQDPECVEGQVQHDEIHFKLIKNEKNVGFAKANNIGIKQAEGKYILFLNSDTVVYPKTFDVMVEFMDKNKDAGAATCKVMLPNGKLDDASHRGFPTPWNSFSHFSGISKIFAKSKLFSGYNLGYLNLEKTHEIDALAGAFMIVRCEAGEKAGWWDEDFFWYGDDLDFCFRLKKAGYKIFYVPDVSILHYKGASSGIKKISKDITSADKKTKRLAQKARFDAMRIFYKKHYQNQYPWYINHLVSGGIFLRQRFS